MDAVAAHEQFVHVRIIVGIVTGLSVARLLTGLARFVQHPERERIYFVHLGWAIYLLLAVVHFWWFEFALSRIGIWTFPVYFFIICYAALFFFLSTILFPDRMEEYSGYDQYFHSRQKWFYGLFAAILLVDIVDTSLKGAEHLRYLGAGYLARQAVLGALAAGAMFIRDRRYHLAFVAIAIISQAVWILSQFDVLG